MKEQYSQIDIIKGVCILLVVLGHSGINPSLYNFIYLFHLPCFFICAGFCSFNRKIENFIDLKKYLLKKIKSLYFPFVIGNLIFLFLAPLFSNFGFISYQNFSFFYFVKNVLKIFLFIGENELCGPTWFLRTLFFVYIIYSILKVFLFKISKDFLITNNLIVIVISFFGYNAFFAEKSFFISEIYKVFSCYVLFSIGVFFSSIYDEIYSYLEKNKLYICIWGGTC